MFVLAGCTSRPDFLARSQQDCGLGDREACRMLQVLDPPRMGKAPLSRATQTEKDVQAILQGMARAKASPRTGYRENVPLPEAPAQVAPAAPQPMPAQAPAQEPGPQ
ncbi:conserved protein of unknown function [Rhodovastum atsumiense]|nr:conserved protein of unknown function [Rhodovastum atsumiense]